MKHLYHITLGCLFLVLFLSLTPSRVRSEILLTEVRIHNSSNHSKYKEKIENLIPFNKGQSLTKDQLEESIKLLKNLNFFKSVDYELKNRGGNRYQLILNVQTGPKVRGLSVRGNYPLLARQITKLINMQTGSVFDASLIPPSQEAVIHFLKRHGFYDSIVTIETKKVPKYDAIDLKIVIKKGHSYRIKQVNITGNDVLSDNRITQHLKHFSRFKMSRYKKDIRSLKEIYAKKGYIKARIKTESIDFDHDTKKITINLKVRENKKLKIKITGKTFFKVNRLKGITKLKERRSYDRYAVRSGKMRLKSHYERQGFPYVDIKSKIIKDVSNEVTVQYTVNAGQRVEVKRIDIKGNKSIGTKKLKKDIKTHESSLFTRAYYNKNKVIQNYADLFHAYRKQGYFNARVNTPVIETNKIGDQKKIIFPVSEGQRYRISSVQFLSDDTLPNDKLLKKSGLKTGRPFDIIKLRKSNNKVIDYLQSQGYAYANVLVEPQINHDQTTVDIQFKIKLGPKVRINSITIDGHMLTKEKTIYKNLKLKTGDLFIFNKMLNAQLNLRKLGIFSSVRITPIGFELESSKIDLHINLVERKSIIVNVQAGVDSRRFVTGELNFTKLNLLGTAKQLNVRGIAGQKYSRGELTFFSPRIFGANWNLSNQYFVEYEDAPKFEATSYGGFINTLKNFGPHWTVGFKEQITRTNLNEASSNVAALGNSLFDNTFNELQFTAILDLRDNFSDPQKGILAMTVNELNTDLADVKNNFDIFEFNISHYLGFLKRFTLVNTYRFGYTFKFSGNPRIPANKLFFLGGADTVRGFEEDGLDPSGGTMMMIYNAELQFRLTDSIKFAGFFDAGLLGNSLNDVTSSNIRESAGIGLRYFTPIGPLRLDWGFNLDRRPGEPKSKVHFSFGYFF